MKWKRKKKLLLRSGPIVFSLQVSRVSAEWAGEQRQKAKPSNIIDYKEKMYSKCFRNMEFVIDFRHFESLGQQIRVCPSVCVCVWECVYVN